MLAGSGWCQLPTAKYEGIVPVVAALQHLAYEYFVIAAVISRPLAALKRCDRILQDRQAVQTPMPRDAGKTVCALA